MTDLILQSLDDNGVLTITLNRPNVLNSLNRPIIEDLIKAFNDASTNAEVRVVVLT